MPSELTWLDVLAVVSAQANDEGLWFEAVTAPEAYLQQELRGLHDIIETVAIAQGLVTPASPIGPVSIVP